LQYRNLGRSGLKVSALAFGSWVTFGEQVDEAVAGACMEAAREAGVNFFDNAESYAAGKSETMMGGVIKHLGWKRSDLVLSTKIFWGGEGPNDRGLSRKHIVEGTRAAMERLQVDYVDLVFCHRPDAEVPIDETVRAMSHVVERGWAFYWGTSEWSADQIRHAYEFARREHLVPPTMEQPQYSMVHRDRVEREYARLYGDVGLGLTIWSPLASGVLTGKYDDGVPDGSRMTMPGYEWLRALFESDEGRRKVDTARKLTPIADGLGTNRAALALAWCLKNPNVSTVITGASTAEQVRENMKALDVVEKLTPEILDEIEAVLGNRPAAELDWRKR